MTKQEHSPTMQRRPSPSPIDRVLEELDSSRVSRRQLLRLTAAATAATAGASLLAACGSDSGSGTTASAAATGTATAAPTAVTDGKVVFLQFSGNEYQQIAGEAFLGAALALGLQGSLLNGNADSNTQLNQFNESLAKGQNGIFLIGIDGVSIQNLTTSAKQDEVYFLNVFATTPWFTPWDASDYYTLYAVPDETVGLVGVVDVLAKALGEEGEVVRVQGIKGGTANDTINAGWEQGLAKYPNIKLVGDMESQWTAETGATSTEALLTRYPNAKAVLTNAEDIATGAVSAIQKLGKVPGKDILVVSNDGTRLGLERIAAGTQLASSGTVPSYPGFLAASRFFDVLSGWKPGVGDRMLYWKPTVITKDNVKQWSSRFVDLAPGKQFNATLLSRVKSPDTWDPQADVYPIELGSLWGQYDKPKGYTLPEAYTKAQSDGSYAKAKQEYADHYKAKILGPVPA
jgi:ABC-type sugar transport system substrate-binding protein